MKRLLELVHDDTPHVSEYAVAGKSSEQVVWCPMCLSHAFHIARYLPCCVCILNLDLKFNISLNCARCLIALAVISFMVEQGQRPNGQALEGRDRQAAVA